MSWEGLEVDAMVLIISSSIRGIYEYREYICDFRSKAFVLWWVEEQYRPFYAYEDDDDDDAQRHQWTHIATWQILTIIVMEVENVKIINKTDTLKYTASLRDERFAGAFEIHFCDYVRLSWIDGWLVCPSSGKIFRMFLRHIH